MSKHAPDDRVDPNGLSGDAISRAK